MKLVPISDEQQAEFDEQKLRYEQEPVLHEHKNEWEMYLAGLELLTPEQRALFGINVEQGKAQEVAEMVMQQAISNGYVNPKRRRSHKKTRRNQNPQTRSV